MTEGADDKSSPAAPRRRRRWLRWFGVFVVVNLVLYFGCTFIATWKLVHRYKPLRVESPAPVGLGVENVRLKTRDGEDLGAWWMPGAAGKPVVLFLHGLGGSRSNAVPVMQRLHADGYGALSLTLRGHGDSTGDLIDFGYSSRADAIAGVELIKQRSPDARIVICGTSLGSAAAMYAGKELGQRVNGYIFESPYRDLEIATRNRLEMRLPKLVANFIYPGMKFWARVFFTFNPSVQTPVAACKEIPTDIPVVVLAGERDRFATMREAEDIGLALSSHGRVVKFARAGHAVLFRVDPETYYSELKKVMGEGKK